MTRGAILAKQAQRIVREYVVSHMPENVLEYCELPEIEVNIVGQFKVMQNWKFLLTSSFSDKRYYEITYDADKDEFLLDAYTKDENIVVKVYKVN